MYISSRFTNEGKFAPLVYLFKNSKLTKHKIYVNLSTCGILTEVWFYINLKFQLSRIINVEESEQGKSTGDILVVDISRFIFDSDWPSIDEAIDVTQNNHKFNFLIGLPFMVLCGA